MENYLVKKKKSQEAKTSVLVDKIIEEMNSKKNSDIINSLISNNSIFQILKDSETFDKSVIVRELRCRA